MIKGVFNVSKEIALMTEVRPLSTPANTGIHSDWTKADKTMHC